MNQKKTQNGEKYHKKTSEKTSELIEAGAVKTKEGLSVVSDTIKKMMSGSPPYLSTMSDLTKILLRNSDIGTKIARDHLNAQFESMMSSEERHEEDVVDSAPERTPVASPELDNAEKSRINLEDDSLSYFKKLAEEV